MEPARPARTCCATVAPPTWWSTAPTCAACSACSATPTLPPRRSTPTSPWSTSSASTAITIPAASAGREQRSRCRASRHSSVGGWRCRMKPVASEFEALAEQFLAMLQNERNASAHTLRAYRREVLSFAAYLRETLGEQREDRRRRPPAHPRLPRPALRARPHQGQRRARSRRDPLLVPLAGQGAQDRAESGRPRQHAQAAAAPSPRAQHGRGQRPAELHGDQRRRGHKE